MLKKCCCCKKRASSEAKKKPGNLSSQRAHSTKLPEFELEMDDMDGEIGTHDESDELNLLQDTSLSRTNSSSEDDPFNLRSLMQQSNDDNINVPLSSGAWMSSSRSPPSAKDKSSDAGATFDAFGRIRPNNTHRV